MMNIKLPVGVEVMLEDGHYPLNFGNAVALISMTAPIEVTVVSESNDKYVVSFKKDRKYLEVQCEYENFLRVKSGGEWLQLPQIEKDLKEDYRNKLYDILDKGTVFAMSGKDKHYPNMSFELIGKYLNKNNLENPILLMFPSMDIPLNKLDVEYILLNNLKNSQGSAGNKPFDMKVPVNKLEHLGRYVKLSKSVYVLPQSPTCEQEVPYRAMKGDFYEVVSIDPLVLKHPTLGYTFTYEHTTSKAFHEDYHYVDPKGNVAKLYNGYFITMRNEFDCSDLTCIKYVPSEGLTPEFRKMLSLKCVLDFSIQQFSKKGEKVYV